jgi:hypothetical protein
MTSAVIPTEIDQTVALEWLQHSLGQGEIVSPAALKTIEERGGHAYTLASETVDPARLTKPSDGWVIEPGAGSSRDAALAQVVETLAERGAACVVVEDCLRLRKDPKPSLDGLLLTAFIGEQVIHWAGLEGGADAAVLTLHRGSGKYPLNAFVTSASAEKLELVDGAEFARDLAGPVVGSLMAVVVAAYDAETYIIWEPS